MDLKASNSALLESKILENGGRVELYPNQPFSKVINDYKFRSHLFKRHFLEQQPNPKGDWTLQFEVCNSLEFNALAGIFQNDGPCILVNFGIISRLKAVFDSMLALPNLFHDIGNPNCRLGDHSRIYNLNRGDGIVLGYQGLPVSNCETRLEVSRFLFELAIDWVFIHEFAHLAHGHVDWLAAEFNIFQFDERGISKRREVSKIDQLTLEMDADSVAASNILLKSIQFAGADLANSVSFTDRQDLIGFDNRFFAAHLVIYTIMVELFDGRSFENLEELLVLTHPPADMRLAMNMNVMFTTLLNNKVICGEEYLSKFGTIIDRCSEVYSLATKGFYNKVGSSRQTPVDLLTPLLRNWPSIRPKIERHLRSGQLAQVQDL